VILLTHSGTGFAWDCACGRRNHDDWERVPRGEENAMVRAFFEATTGAAPGSGQMGRPPRNVTCSGCDTTFVAQVAPWTRKEEES